MRAVTIPHAVPEVFFDAKVPSRSGRGLRLLFVGELSKQKGIDKLLTLHRQLSQTNEIMLTVVGDGPLRTLVEQYAQEKFIRYVGRITDRAELAAEMSAHDVLILLSQRTPKWEELFGIVLVEAMAAGLGVVASNHIGPRSIFGGAELGNLFSEDDDAGVSGLLRTLAGSPEALDRFKAAHARVAARYRSREVERLWLAILG